MKIALPLVGIMAIWLGVMRLAERAGLVQLIARALRPLMRRLFPDVPPDHPAMGSMVMNMAANMLGLGNAATPLGLRAMADSRTAQSASRHGDERDVHFPRDQYRLDSTHPDHGDWFSRDRRFAQCHGHRADGLLRLALRRDLWRALGKAPGKAARFSVAARRFPGRRCRRGEAFG